MNINQIRSREDLISHCTLLSQKLFYPENPQKVILIWDGTYIYIEKSAQHKFQKNTYNSHKKRNYVKPMMIVTTGGTIVCAIGPFKAIENDATITKKILLKDVPALQNLQAEDVMIVDRGFRDCRIEFQNCGFLVEIPASEPSNKQLSVLDANKARLITKVRYEVERLNGLVKTRFKIFANVWKSLSVPHLMDDFTIACALLNKFHTKRSYNSNSEDIGNKMLALLHQKNELHGIISKSYFKSLLTKKEYTIFNSFHDFPELTMDDLHSISFGCYQVKQAMLYAYDHMEMNNNQFQLFVFSEHIAKNYCSAIQGVTDPLLLLLNIGSRFVSGRRYKTFLLFDRSYVGKEAIKGYCCNCKIGLRVVGCCSHVMTILYYLGYAVRNGGVVQKAKHLDRVFEDFQDDTDDEFIEMDENEEEY